MDIETSLKVAQERYNAEESVHLARERVIQAERTGHICEAVMNRLCELTADLDLCSLHQVVDTLHCRLGDKLDEITEKGIEQEDEDDD